MAERPATLARFLVTKHSWRGRYRRILGVAEDGLYTVNPITFETTNAWSYASDLVGVGASDGSDEDFFLALTHDPDGLIKLSFGTHKKLWSCEHRAELLTAIQRARAAAASKAPPRSRGQLGADPSLACLRMPAARIECVAPDGTPVWTELSLVATAVALEIRDPASDELLDDLPYASLRGFCAFSDLHGGFLVQRKRRPRAEAFRCAQLPELLRHVLSALPRLGVALALGQGLPVPAVAAAASAARVGATPPTLLAVWCSARAADDASYRPHQLRCEAYRHTPLGPLSVTLLVSEDELIERVGSRPFASSACVCAHRWRGRVLLPPSCPACPAALLPSCSAALLSPRPHVLAAALLRTAPPRVRAVRSACAGAQRVGGARGVPSLRACSSCAAAALGHARVPRARVRGRRCTRGQLPVRGVRVHRARRAA